MKKPENSLLAEALAMTGEARDRRLEVVADHLRQEMESLACSLKDMILSQPTQELLGYLWSHWLRLPVESGQGRTQPTPEGERDPLLVALEYVHAILSCFERRTGEKIEFREEIAKEILNASDRVENITSQYCLVSSLLR